MSNEKAFVLNPLCVLQISLSMAYFSEVLIPAVQQSMDLKIDPLLHATGQKYYKIEHLLPKSSGSIFEIVLLSKLQGKAQLLGKRRHGKRHSTVNARPYQTVK